LQLTIADCNINYLEFLPFELLENIFDFMEVDTLWQISQTCKHLRECATVAFMCTGRNKAKIPVARIEGERLAKEIGAIEYVETSYNLDPTYYDLFTRCCKVETSECLVM